MRIDEALALGRQQLATTSDAPDLDATRLLLGVLHQTEISWLLTRSDLELTPAKANVYESLLTERAAGTPLAYILGKQEFYGREFIVSPKVLIPRPETEEVVSQALQAIDQLVTKHQRPITIADIGTGSGCIAITLALETNSTQVAHIYATDISPEALIIAERNVQQHHVIDRVTLMTGNLLEPLKDIAIDLIISNPPYIPTAELEKSLSAPSPTTKGLQFEPRLALDGGPDGNTYIDQLKAPGIPLIVEGYSGAVFTYNL